MEETSIWRGRLVRLRAIEPEDWERYWQDSDEDSLSQRSGYFIHFPQSRERARERSRDQSLANLDNAERIQLAIESRKSDALVGSISAHGLDRRNGTFEYGIGIFREHWRKGYAGEAATLLFRYLFDELRFQKVNATVYEFNESSLGFHRKFGFTEEGRIRRNLFTGGRHYDEYWFGMTAEEFRARHPRRDGE